MIKIKKGKTCSVGANCKNTCISKEKQCLVELSLKASKQVAQAATKLIKEPGSKASNKSDSLVNKAEKAFISKGGSIPAAAKLLQTLIERSPEPSSLPRFKPGSESLLPHAADFYKLTGRTQRVSDIAIAPGRSQADRRAGSIRINDKANSIQQRKELFHELGHFAGKSTPKASAAEQKFIEDRKEPGSKPELLSVITGQKSYGTERAWKGKFKNPYTAKYYISGATEVFSTGLERFSSASELSKFYKEDPKHFALIMRYIKGDFD